MIIRAVDVGYGNVKYTIRRDSVNILCGHFPAVAPLSTGSDIGNGVTARRDIFRVNVGNTEYLVGNDAVSSLRLDTGRVLSAEYPETSQYLALVYGALAYMNVPEIDYLVTGLPVEYFKQYREKLAARLVGSHAFPDGRHIKVKKASIIPQPIGGFLNYAVGNNLYDGLRESNCLIIDVGFFTVDWLVCKGIKVIDERSGSVSLGVSRVLELLANAISNDRDKRFSDINRLDQALRHGHKIEIAGKPYDFNHLLQKVTPVIDNACLRISGSVGDMDDISTVVLVGGGAQLYLEGVRKICKQNPLVVVDDAIYANVRGFMIAEERGAQRNGQ
jgi:plasmid segregation protein ParM